MESLPSFDNLFLYRPLAVFDLETTGGDPDEDRIVEFGACVIKPDHSSAVYLLRFNPGMPISPEATVVHGISNDDVASSPLLISQLHVIEEILDGCDLAGFNIKKFDLPILCNEFQRCGKEFSLAGRSVLDVMEVFHRRERRDLKAAVEFYCHKEHKTAHSAEGDSVATAEVLNAMFRHYSDMPNTITGLALSMSPDDSVDIAGCFKRDGDEIRFCFGKHNGKLLRDVKAIDPRYLQWMLQQKFFDDVKSIIRDVLGINKISRG